MSIQDQVAHLANLTFIMDFHEKLGTTKNPLIVQEFERGHAELVKALEEKENETRNRKDDGIRHEAGADQPRSQPRVRIPDWPTNQQPPPRADVRRPGA